MKCAICGKPVQVGGRSSRSFHTACAIASNARTEERADLLAYLKRYEWEIPLGIFVEIEKGDHVGAAGKVKP